MTDAEQKYIAAAKALNEAAYELKARTANFDREAKLADAKFQQLIALMNSMDDDFKSFVAAVEALGAMPEGYCFCSKDRIGDDSKTHEPECADLRAFIARIYGAAVMTHTQPTIAGMGAYEGLQSGVLLQQKITRNAKLALADLDNVTFALVVTEALRRRPALVASSIIAEVTK